MSSIKNRIYPLSIIILVTLVFSTFVGIASADQCQDCHGTDGGYTFQHLEVSPITPRVVSPGEIFQHKIQLTHPGQYLASAITVEIDLSSATNLELTSKKIVKAEDFASGQKVIIFEIKAGEPHQSQKIRTIVKYTASLHYTPTVFIEKLDISVTIDQIVLEPSTWTLDMNTDSKSKLTLTAREAVRNITLIPSESLNEIAELKYDTPNQMSSGQVFDIEIIAKDKGLGKINYVYEDLHGIPHKATIDVVIIPQTGASHKIWEPIGMITGILSWVLLFLMTVIGAPIKKLKSKFNKYFGKAVVRNEFHCAMSYILVVLALFHAVVVMGNHWNSAMLANSFIIADPANEYGLYINLGTVAWIFMILVSVTGIFWKQLIKIFNYKTWRWTHNIFTIVALTTAVIHGIILLHWRFF